MEYRKIAGLADSQPWAARYKATLDIDNEAILAERQVLLDQRQTIGVGDFVIDGHTLLRVAHDWGEGVQLTDGRRCGGTFFLGDGFVDFSGGLAPGIKNKSRFLPTDERRLGSVWFFSRNYVTAHNGYDTHAKFRVWKLVE